MKAKSSLKMVKHLTISLKLFFYGLLYKDIHGGRALLEMPLTKAELYQDYQWVYQSHVTAADTITAPCRSHISK